MHKRVLLHVIKSRLMAIVEKELKERQMGSDPKCMHILHMTFVFLC